MLKYMKVHKYVHVSISQLLLPNVHTYVVFKRIKSLKNTYECTYVNNVLPRMIQKNLNSSLDKSSQYIQRT